MHARASNKRQWYNISSGRGHYSGPAMSLSTLFLVATPIGNLEDITLRALRVLREADLIAAEDTRHTAKLLAHFDIHTKTTSFYEQVEREKTPRLLEHLASGRSPRARLRRRHARHLRPRLPADARRHRGRVPRGGRSRSVGGARGPGALRASDRLVLIRRIPAAKGEGARGVAPRTGGPPGDAGVLRGAAPHSTHARGGAGCLGRSTDFGRPRVDEAARGDGARQCFGGARQAAASREESSRSCWRALRKRRCPPLCRPELNSCWKNFID